MNHPVMDINETSRNILEGDYNTAIVSLTKTLKNVKLAVSGDVKISMPKEHQSSEIRSISSDLMDLCDSKEQDPMPSATLDPFEYDFYYPSEDSTSFLNTSVPMREPIDCNYCCPSLEEQTVSIFKNPLVVKGSCYEVPIDTQLCEELSCVVIYNLALSHQLKAMSLSRSSAHNDRLCYLTCMRKALRLYEFSHFILNKQSFSARVPALFCMALVSNLGQIHNLLGDVPKATICNEHLLSVLMYAIDRGKLNNFVPPGVDQQVLFEGFLAIVQHLFISNDCLAPAA